MLRPRIERHSERNVGDLRKRKILVTDAAVVSFTNRELTTTASTKSISSFDLTAMKQELFARQQRPEDPVKLGRLEVKINELRMSNS